MVCRLHPGKSLATRGLFFSSDTDWLMVGCATGGYGTDSDFFHVKVGSNTVCVVVAARADADAVNCSIVAICTEASTANCVGCIFRLGQVGVLPECNQLVGAAGAGIKVHSFVPGLEVLVPPSPVTVSVYTVEVVSG